MEDDLSVHRFRVGSYLPRPIKSIAVESIYSNKTAVGREDGQIEVAALLSVELSFIFLLDS
jgi:hypothetical protein